MVETCPSINAGLTVWNIIAVQDPKLRVSVIEKTMKGIGGCPRLIKDHLDSYKYMMQLQKKRDTENR